MTIFSYHKDGCLILDIFGSHRWALSGRYKCDKAQKCSFETLEETPWPEESYVLLEAPEGTLIIFHSKFVHKSAENRSARSRQAYVTHLFSGAATYLCYNWAQRSDFVRLSDGSAQIHPPPKRRVLS